MTRQSWDEYFSNIASITALRSTCLRKQVGCVIVKNKTIIATGYNGSLPGEPHCIDVGCYMKDNHCVRTMHSETNAINQAAKNGTSLFGAVIYCTLEPCWGCFKNIISAGIHKIYFKESYGSENQMRTSYLKRNNIIYEKI